MPKLSFHEVDQTRWIDFERLFESRGGPKYCWCMAWRATGAEARTKGSARKAAIERRVHAGVPIGLLGYLDEEPVAWFRSRHDRVIVRSAAPMSPVTL
jgi:hypothetical protein